MAAVSVEELYAQVNRVRENPNLPQQNGNELSHDDLRQTVKGARSALISAIKKAPDGAFAPQPDNDEGEEVWSIGEIVGHCNEALISIGSGAQELIGVDAGDPPAGLRSTSGPRTMSREEALQAANAFDADEYFEMIPDDERLDNASEHDFFGTMSARAWLYFIAMHESDHIYQIRSLG
ncbi:MAG: DinB family protein [Thermomicrobiales bacterium]